MLNKDDIYKLLDENNVSYEKYEHIPVFTIEEMDAVEVPHKEWIVKNLFLRDDKKRNYYLVTLLGHKKVDLKELSQKIPSRRLSFASEDKLKELLSLEKGHVTPLGILNNEQKNVKLVIDDELEDKKIGVHPLANTATAFIAVRDIIKLAKTHGNEIIMCQI